MPYGEKSAYEAQAKLKGQSPAYKKSSGFKMKSPLKQHEAEAMSTYVTPPIVPVVLETSNGENGGELPFGKAMKTSKKLKKIKEKKFNPKKEGYKFQ